MKKILIVVDMQNDFIDAALGTKEAVAIVPAVIEKIKNYKGELVIATRDTHQKNYMETSEGKHLPVPHCIEGTYGWEIRSDIAEALDEVGAQVINKPTFGSVALAEKLTVLVQEWDLKEEDLEIELIGLCTDICVVSNALLLKANFPEAVIKLDSACCAGVTPESHEAALITMRMCQVEVV
ncbi:MAG: cysteine hydrolase [Lachnospiraceae bacterium]|nr:cysteine hydrolase [Lachnospiraceae bacterium]